MKDFSRSESLEKKLAMLDRRTMQDIVHDRLYQRYVLDWMMKNGYDLLDVFDAVDRYRADHPTDSALRALGRWWMGTRSAGDLKWKPYNEFIRGEYLDTDYMLGILNDDEKGVYLKDIAPIVGRKGAR